MPASPPSQFIPLISAFHPVKRVYRIKTLHLAFHRVLSEHPGHPFLQSLFAEHLRDARCWRSGGGKWGRRALLGPCRCVLIWESSHHGPLCSDGSLRELPGAEEGGPNAGCGLQSGRPGKASRRAVFKSAVLKTHTLTHTHKSAVLKTHAHTHTHTKVLSLRHTHSPTHTKVLSLRRTHSLTHTKVLSLIHTHSHTHTKVLSLRHMHSHTHTKVLSLRHTHSPTHTNT